MSLDGAGRRPRTAGGCGGRTGPLRGAAVGAAGPPSLQGEQPAHHPGEGSPAEAHDLSQKCGETAPSSASVVRGRPRPQLSARCQLLRRVLRCFVHLIAARPAHRLPCPRRPDVWDPRGILLGRGLLCPTRRRTEPRAREPPAWRLAEPEVCESHLRPDAGSQIASLTVLASGAIRQGTALSPSCASLQTLSKAPPSR